jgi:DNA topoisomerase-3
MKSLVLAEKPSVAREIARVLGCSQKHKSHIEGSRYVVTWALGHLVELAEPQDYDKKYSTWKLEDLPIMPPRMRLKVIRQTSHQFKAIGSLAKRSDLGELIIATDAGREGELVARWIMELVHWRKPFKRLWISSQTDRAIKDGFAGLNLATPMTTCFNPPFAGPKPTGWLA